MRPWLAGVVVLAFFAPAGRAVAVEYPWCAHYSMEGDVSNCGFTSLEQCRMTVTAGSAGICQRNPFYVAPRSASRPKPATRRPHKG